MIKNAQELLALSKSLTGSKTVSVAMANDTAVLKAVAEARHEGIVDAILVGDKERMEEIASEENFSLENLQIIHETDEKKACEKSVELILEGKAQFLMKGFVKTSTLLKTILSKPELKEKDVLSHVAVLDIPGRDKLFMFSDGGMVINPDKKQKVDIGKNMIALAHSLDILPFSFGFLAPFDNSLSNDNQYASDILSKSESNINISVSVSSETALQDLDGLIASSIEECNTITKGLTIFTDTVFAGLIMGTKVPICLVSRADSAANKKASLALGAVYSNRRAK